MVYAETTVACPKCGAEVPETALFCGCGEYLPEQTICRRCGLLSSRAYSACPRCGQEIVGSSALRWWIALVALTFAAVVVAFLAHSLHESWNPALAEAGGLWVLAVASQVYRWHRSQRTRRRQELFTEALRTAQDPQLREEMAGGLVAARRALEAKLARRAASQLETKFLAAKSDRIERPFRAGLAYTGRVMIPVVILASVYVFSMLYLGLPVWSGWVWGAVSGVTVFIVSVCFGYTYTAHRIGITTARWVFVGLVLVVMIVGVLLCSRILQPS